MMIPDPVQNWLIEHGYGHIQSKKPVAGGCISNGQILVTQSGTTFFLKTNANIPADAFAREAEGLQALRVDDGPVVPRPLLFSKNFILMEDLNPAPRQVDYWAAFGRQLAAVHLHTHPKFGFVNDNYIGSSTQPNPWVADGDLFFGEQRLLYQAEMARQRGLLGQTEIRAVEKLAAQLPGLIPEQPASLLHGDLWSGNAITDSQGNPAIIDPAVYYGWAEAELAMTALFGSFPDTFYQAYEEVRPLEPGYYGRFPIYNLYHLLNHLNIFGRGYLGQVQTTLQRFS